MRKYRFPVILCESCNIEVVPRSAGQKYCKTCGLVAAKKTQRNWCERNAERNSEFKKKYYRENKERILKRINKWAKANPHRIASYHRKRKYGIDREEFDAMLLSQDNKCAVCFGDLPKSPSVDHDHATGKIREILCTSCNHLLGQAKDDPVILQSAINYLNKHRSPNALDSRREEGEESPAG